MSVLNIKHGIVSRLLRDFHEVEVERRVVLPVEHHEADGPCSDLFYGLPKRHERPGTLGHLDGLPSPKQAHQLADLDVEFGLALGQRSDRCLHAPDMTAV